ncbi:MAG: nuclear transport factor 2 family protein [Phycisphaerales bacterium]
MRRSIPYFAMALIAGLLTGCSSSNGPSSRDTRPAEVIGHEAHEAFVDAINSNDLDTFLSSVTDDVVFMPPHGPRLVGRAEVAPWAAGYLDAYSIHWTKTTLEFVVSGDWAFEQYSYESADTPRDGGGEVVRDRGKGIAIFRREADGVWRVARDAWNSDLPASTGN